MSDSTYFHHVFDTFPVLETPRLRLRQLEAADAQDVFQIYADSEVTRYYDLETFTDLQQAQALISRQLGRFHQKAGLRWAITFKEEDTVIGSVGIMLYPENKMGGIGYDLARPYWRLGIMSEVLQAVIQFAFETAGVERIQALVMPGNTASATLLEKLGFRDQGLLQNHAFFKGKFQDLHNFILTK
jgi:[ribosomal protein S5]-alanine N-acetyltransferase